jgi:type II secretory pathway pseudopilin PulG
MRELRHVSGQRFDPQAGIAIGPILFIIAILAILAAAIAAGSGNFTSGTTTESNRTKAAALIQIGENLKIGADRLTMENEVPLATIDFNVSDTGSDPNAANELFSPTGGGITPPSYSLANNPSNDGTAANGDIWFFPNGTVPGLGVNTGTDLFAVLSVSQGVCSEVNNKANSLATPAAANLGDFTVVNSQDSAVSSGWPATLYGRTVGCVQNGSMNNEYFFYQVLVID